MKSYQSSVVSSQSVVNPAIRSASAPGLCGLRTERSGGLRRPARLISDVLALLLMVLTGAAHAQEPIDPLDKPLRHIFVPLDEFDAVMARDRQGVLLKKAEFDALVADAIKNKPAGVQPTGLVVSSAIYVAKIDGDQLVITATIQFTNFEKSWAEFHIPCDGLSVEKCQINGQPALAGWHGENPNILRVFTDQPGPGTLTLELSAHLTAVGSDLATAFGIMPAGSGELVVSLPAGKFLQESHNEFPRSAPADQPAEYHIALGGHKSVNLQITNRQASTRKDLLILANTAIAVTVAPGEVSWAAKAALQVVGRPVDRIVCTVPMSLEITSVESTGLDSWQLADTPDDPARTTITLAYRQPFEGSREITFRGVLKAANDMAWEVPTLVFNDITSQVGIAEVRYPAGVRLRVGELDGVRTIVSQAVTAENGDSLLHFQIWKPRFKLPFVTEPKTREVRAAVTNLLDLNTTNLDFTSVINLQTRLAPLFDAQINIPAEWQVSTMFLGDQPITWQVVPQQAGINQIRITFPTPIPADGSVSLTLNARLEPEKWPVEDQPMQIALPRVQLPQAGVIEGLYGITAETALDVVPVEISGLDPPSPSELAILRQKIAAFGREIRLGFSLQDTAYHGTLNVSRKPARVSSHESTFFRIEPDTLNTHIESQLRIEGGGVRRLMIDLPEASGTDLRFQLDPFFPVALDSRNAALLQGIPFPPKIVEQTAAPAKNGIRRWTLRFDRYGNDTYLLSVDIRQPRPAKGPFNCPVMTVIGAERETGFVAIEASQEQFLSPLAIDVSGQPLLKVDPIDFPPAAYRPKEAIVAGYRYTRPGWALAVGEQRFDRAQVPTAVGHSANYKTVLGRNGELQHQADLEFTAIGIQNLKVRLPADVELWAVQMDGQPQEIRRQGDGLLVAVPQNAQADQHHTLTLFYRSHLAGPLTADFRQSPPVFTVLDGQGAEQPLNILQQSWQLFHPYELLLIESPGAFQPTADLDQDGKLGRWSSLFRAPSPKQIFGALFLVSIVFLVVWGIRKTVERFGWLRSLCGVAAGAVLVALMLPATQQAREAARRSTARNEQKQAEYERELAATTAPAPMAAPMGLPGGGGGGGFGGGSGAMNGEWAQQSTDAPMAVDQGPETAKPEGLALPSSSKTPQAPPTNAPAPAATEFAPAPWEQPQMSEERAESSAGEKMSQSDKESVARRGFGFRGDNRKDRARDGAQPSEGDESFEQKKLTPPQPAVNGPVSGEGKPGDDFGASHGVNGITPGQKPASPKINIVGRENWPSRTVAGMSAPGQYDGDLNVPLRSGSIDYSDAVSVGGLIAPRKPGQSQQAAEAAQVQLGGLLSLALSLSAPEDSMKHEFTFLGNGSASTDLHLKFTRRDKSRDWTCFVMAVVFVAGWFARKLPLSLRAAMVAVLILGSIAIAPLLRTRCQPIIDGLFFGGWGVLIQCVVCWLISRIKCCCCRPKVSPPSSTPLTTVAVLLACLLCPALSPAEEAVAKPVEPPWEPHVVLPYTGDDPTTADRVFLPQRLFLELWKKAHPEEAPKAKAPVDGWVVEALHAATFEQTGNTAVIHVKSRMVLITTLETQFAQVLPIREVALTHAVIDGKPAVLQAEGGGYKVVVAEKGTHVLDVEFDLPAITEGAAGRFTLKTLPTAAAKLSVQLPKIMGDRDLKVNGATGAYRIRDTEAGPVLDTAVDRGGDITVSWQPRAVRGAGNTILHVDTGEAIIVDDTGLQVNHQFAYRVRQGSITEVAFEAPAALAIREISGPDVGGWQLDEAQGMTRRLRVFLRRTVEDQTSILIDLFTPLPVTDVTQTLPIPELIPIDATREIGQIGLFAGGEFAVRAVDVKGAVQIDVAKYQPVAVPHRPAEAPLAAYRYATRPASLTLSLSRRQPETKCLTEHGVLIGTRKQEWASRFLFDLTGAPRPSVSVTLPPNYLLMDVEGSDFINDWYDSPGEGGSRTLTVEFDQPRLGRVELLLTGLVARLPDSNSVDLLTPQPIGVAKLNSSLAVWLSDIYSATVRSSEGWKTAPPEQLSNELQHLRQTPIQFAYRANAVVHTPVVVDLTRQVAQLSADLVTLVAVADDSVDYGLTFRWKISRAAADTFQFTTPSWLKDRLELNVPGVRQIGSVATENGDILWTIQLVDAVRNQFLCTGVVTLPPPADDIIQIPDVQFLDTIVAGKQHPLESQRRCAIVVNRSSGQLVAVDERLVNKLPKDQLPLLVDNSLLVQAMAITELSSEQAMPKWKLIRSATQDTGKATITGSELVTSLAWDGSWKTKATYTVRNRGQQFLGLKLPEGSQLMSVFVKGRASRTVTTQLNGKTVHLVPLPQTSVVDLSFPVEVTLGGQLPTPIEKGAHLSAQEVSLPAPEVITRAESAEFGLTVASTLWKVFTPDKLDVTLVNDGTRSNVDQLSADDIFAMQEIKKSERLESDLKEQLKIKNDPHSDSLKQAQVQNNLKQLQVELQLQCATIENNTPAKPESAQRYNEAKNLNGRLLEEVTRNSVDLPGAQQPAPQQTDGTSNRAYILGNNDLNYKGNSFSDSTALGDSSGKLEFKSSGVDGEKRDQVVTKARASKGRGVLRKSLEDQSFSNASQGGQQQYSGGQQGGQQGYFGNDRDRVNLRRTGRTGRLEFGNGAQMGGVPQSRSGAMNNGGNGVQQQQSQLREQPPILNRIPSRYRFNQPSDLNEGGGAMSNFANGGYVDSSMWGVSGGIPLQGGTSITWTHTGGLSLPITIPTVGSETVFSKVGGSPTLTIALRPRQTWTRSLTWLWSLCWGLLAVWVVRRIRTASSATSLRPVLGIAAALGVLGYLLLPDYTDVRTMSLWVFIVSLLAVMLIGAKRDAANDQASRAA